MGKKLTTETFIERAKLVYGGNKYDYSSVEYINSKTKVKIFCNKCQKSFLKLANVFLTTGCPMCGRNQSKMFKFSNTENFIIKAKLIHGIDKFDYSKVNYINSKTPVTIICENGHLMNQVPNAHLAGKGCIKCANVGQMTTEDFIEKAEKLHGKRYDYSKCIYEKSIKPVIITCDKGHTFNQSPNKHLQGHGCIICNNSENHSGWGVTDWEIKEKNSKHFYKYEIYFIRCWNEFEIFYKIGRTSVGIKRRFNSKKDMPYNYELLKIVSGTAHEIYDLENKMKKKHKLLKYKPNIYFGGMHECYTELIDI